MRNCITWTFFLILPCALVSSLPTPQQHAEAAGGGAGADRGEHSASLHHYHTHHVPKHEQTFNSHDEQVISVRITSSVAVGRGKGKQNKIRGHRHHSAHEPLIASGTETTLFTAATDSAIYKSTSENPQRLVGANIEYLKQLNSKKEARGLDHYENFPLFQPQQNDYSDESHDSMSDSSVKTVLEIGNKDDHGENVPQARSISSPSKNFIHDLTRKRLGERRNQQRLTTVSFNVLHETRNNYNEPSDSYDSPTETLAGPSKYFEPPKFYNEPAKVYSQPAKVYSEPAKFYSDPAKIYSEPAKIYSEPAKIYSEPAKVYSEPAKIYSEPAKFYSQPASLHLPPIEPQNHDTWQPVPQAPAPSSTVIPTTPDINITSAADMSDNRDMEQYPERNYEIEEKVSILTDGQSHGVQETTTESCKQENCKVGYVVEGRQYRKYRVEERTSDGFIVGEYGVVRNEDGALRGVRYTADSDASPRLIYDALMKFLQLK